MHTLVPLPGFSAFAEGERIVQEAKAAVDSASYARSVIVLQRVDCLPTVHQKALLTLLEHSSDGTRAWILTARNLSACLPPLRSRAQPIRCQADDWHEAPDVKSFVKELVELTEQDDCRKKVLDIFKAGITAKEVLRELASQLPGHRLEPFVSLAAHATVRDDDWVSVLTMYMSSVQ